MSNTATTICLRQMDERTALAVIIVAISLILLGPGLFPRIA
ncbi:hypothetical protein ACFL26_02105 [Patescibacteria group bacterium]